MLGIQRNKDPEHVRFGNSEQQMFREAVILKDIQKICIKIIHIILLQELVEIWQFLIQVLL